MAFPLLAQLALALVATKMQNDEENQARAFATRKQFDNTKAAIEAQRASRAGDAGYMQTGIRGFSGNDLPPRRNAAGPMLSQMGAALLAQDSEPNVRARETQELRQPVFSRHGWTGQDADDLVKWGGYA